jgi:glycosyltransferase involved in cell wall biosynthesis
MGHEVTPLRERPAAAYVTYDGALDPLGASQVVPYLLGLAATTRITLISFEKRHRWEERRHRDALQERLSTAGIEWRPLRYHSRPRVPATAWDVARGALEVGRVVHGRGATLVHCRGEVAMLMARQAKLQPGTRLLLDMRGFFADERVESGSWKAGGLVDRVVRSVERENLRRADGLVVLTHRALDVLKEQTDALPPCRIIPTCVDTSSFQPAAAGGDTPFGVVYSGSLGTWYMVDEMVTLARVMTATIPGRTLFLTPDVEIARRAGATPDWADVRAADPADVPQWLRRARASVFIVRPSPAKRASCPTKLAEALASGLPVVANRGIGDVDGYLERVGVGVLIDELSVPGYRRAAAALAVLLEDPETPARCRRLAEERFSLESGVSAYRDLYAELGKGAAA